MNLFYYSGARVMGIAVNGSCKSTVRARTDLLWPIPDHWDFEEAATVPMAYLTAFYCLHFCVVRKKSNIFYFLALVHLNSNLIRYE